MKNFLLFVLFVLAAAGCGVSYLLLRLPQHDVTGLIVKYLAVKPGEAAAEEPRAEAPAKEEAEAVKSEEVQPKEAQAEEVKAEEAKPEPVKPVDPEEGLDWRGLSETNWYAGKKLTQADFKGKVTLVYVWSGKSKPSIEMLGRIQEIWSSFKSKPLVVLGSHRCGPNPKIQKAYGQLGLTFPMYEGAAYYRETPSSTYPYIYIVNHHGKFVYRGSSDRSATEKLVEALTACQLKQ